MSVNMTSVSEQPVSSQPVSSAAREMHHRWTPGQDGRLRIDLDMFRQGESPPRDPRIWLYTYTCDKREQQRLEARFSEVVRRLARPKADEPRYLNRYHSLKEARQERKTRPEFERLAQPSGASKHVGNKDESARLARSMGERQKFERLAQPSGASKHVGNKDESARLARSMGERQKFERLAQPSGASKHVGNKDESARLARSVGERRKFSCSGGAQMTRRPRYKSRHMDWYEPVKERRRQLEECANERRFATETKAAEPKRVVGRLTAAKDRHSPKARHMQVFRRIREKNAHEPPEESKRRPSRQTEASEIGHDLEKVLKWMNRE